MKIVGLVGWRGMVGSVLVQRMLEEGEFKLIEPIFFSTSKAGQLAPLNLAKNEPKIYSATDIDALKRCFAIVTCQGSDYTGDIYPKLRDSGWKGYWIDAASILRMQNDSTIVLDPVNRNIIDNALKADLKDFIGGNCTVSLMLMALSGLFKQNLIEWVTVMTYQAASGAGAQSMRELIQQMGALYQAVSDDLTDTTSSILSIDQKLVNTMRTDAIPVKCFGTPLAGALIPWIDNDLGNGMSKEEWKGEVETNKILGNKTNATNLVKVDGLCVRIGAMRCHSQALTIKLRQDIPLDEIEEIISTSNKWVELVPNRRNEVIARLTPTYVTGSLAIPVGRLRKLRMGGNYLSAFTVGDQLLWGAAEPLRRMLRILIEN